MLASGAMNYSEESDVCYLARRVVDSTEQDKNMDPQKQKRKALTTIVSWLEATNTSHRIQLNDPKVDLLIGKQPVFVTPDMASSFLNSRETALGAFWALTEAAGLGKPLPKFRQQSIALRAHEDNELCAMRHTEFRKVPNNASLFLREDYQKIVSWAVSRFFMFNRSRMKKMGYEQDDLKTYAWVWVCNFHGLHRDVHASDRKNGSHLCNYLQQRFFGDFVKLTKRNEQNVLVDVESVSAAMDFEVTYQWDKGPSTKKVQVAVRPERQEELVDKFKELPVSVQMAELTKVLQKGRVNAIRLEAEDQLLKLDAPLTPEAKRQIKRFHANNTSKLYGDKKEEHSANCTKCHLK